MAQRAGIKRRQSQQRWAQEASTALEQRARLDIYSHPALIRKVAVICTIGPKTASVEKITELREAGLNIVRLNFSHGSHEYHAAVIAATRESVEKFPDVGRAAVAIALDTKGPEIRTGLVKDDKEITIKPGDKLTISVDPAHANECCESLLFMDYPNLPKAMSVGGTIFVDDGLLSLTVVSIGSTSLEVEAVNGATIGSRKGVNLPNVKVDLPALSEKDKGDLKFAVEQGVDMIFASFIRKPQDVKDVRACLGEDGAKIKVISKIENREGLDNFDDILAVSDGIMVARGDMGIEIAPEKVFLAQKMMIAKCNMAGKPVICATQMLESMIHNPRPTRAEVSDVANAVMDGADCVMLSGETAKGAFPVEAVEMMSQCCLEAESAIFFKAVKFGLMQATNSQHRLSEPVALSVVTAAASHHCRAIVSLTQSGASAEILSKFRPPCPILVLSRNPQVLRQLHLYRGCIPLTFTGPKMEDREKDIDARHAFGIAEGKRMGLLRKGDTVVLTYGWSSGKHNRSLTDFRISPVP